MNKAGFTLLEVLLAVVILGTSLTIFFTAAHQGLDVVIDARAYQQARTFLQQLELEEPLDLEDLDEGEDRGTLDGGDQGTVQWKRIVTYEGEEEDELFHIRTEIVWGQQGEYSESVDTLLHKPTAMRGGWVQEPAD